MSVARIGIRGFERVNAESYYRKAVYRAGADAASADVDLAGKALQMLDLYRKGRIAADDTTRSILRAVEMVLYKRYRHTTPSIAAAIDVAVGNAGSVSDIVAAIRGAGGPQPSTNPVTHVLEFELPAGG